VEHHSIVFHNLSSISKCRKVSQTVNNATQQIVNKAWNFAHVLRDDGLSYMAYTEQITFLLFLKMAHEHAFHAED
jgi:type I restriction-modification system DNA methylase subunit